MIEGNATTDVLTWADRPTATQRTGALHAVARLLDTLAPQRPPARREEPTPSIQRVRSPSGCILQAATRAVSVSWFAAGPNEFSLGELRLIAWQGTVSRPGATRPAVGGAVAEREEAYKLVDGGTAGWRWRATDDGATYDAAALAERCYALLADDAAPAVPAAEPADVPAAAKR